MKDLNRKLFKFITKRSTWVSFVYYLLVFIGFSMFLLFIFFNFMRIRLPRDIPFALTEFRFYSLLILCIMYIYTIKTILYPKIPSKLTLKIISIILEPFSFFYSFINRILYKYIYKFKQYILPLLDDCGFYDNVLLIYLMQIFPRIVLLTIFMVDVFWLHKIEVFYYFIILGIIPLLHHILLYFLHHTFEESIEKLENKYKRLWVFEEDFGNVKWEHNPNATHHNTKVSVRQYIEIQYEAFMTYGDNEEYIEYYCEPFCTANYYDEYKEIHHKLDGILDIKDHENLRVYFDKNMPNILILKRFLELNKTTEKTCYIPAIKLFILIIYLISWIYILVVSFHTLQDINITIKIIEILKEYSKIENPFSGIFLINQCMIFPKKDKEKALDKVTFEKLQQKIEEYENKFK